jgi:MFS family permease
VQIGLLFTVYAIPNVFIPLFSGTFFDKLGVWRGVIIISTTIAVGIIVVAVAVALKSYGGMLFGQVIYGLGGESLYVGIDVLTTTWFRGAELGLAYGLVQVWSSPGCVCVCVCVRVRAFCQLWLPSFPHSGSPRVKRVP